jgi:CrcB protein
MTHILAVAAGGAVGSLLRYAASLLVPDGSAPFPWTTLLVNVFGCGLLGLFLGLADARWTTSPELRSFVSIGLFGGFTTFSTFGTQTISLWQDGRWIASALNVVLSVGLGLLAAWGGWRIANSA